MRSAFLKLISARPQQGELPSRQDFKQHLSELFANEADLARLQGQWQQSEFGAAYQKWMDHRIPTGHTPVLLSAIN
jgi:hypothetical protein